MLVNFAPSTIAAGSDMPSDETVRRMQAYAERHRQQQKQRENYRRAAAYVDKILKGAKPGDLLIFDDLVGELPEMQRHLDAERSRSFEVNSEHEFCRKFASTP